MTDITIIGGGIVGIASALEILRTCPGLSVQVLEKENRLASHQTGRNSGVIHAGIYYAPGSMKAEFCRRGLEATVRFCREHGLPYEQPGKLIVATSAIEMERMKALQDRAQRNGLDVRPVSAAELREIEPNITGLGALLSPATGIADYGAIVRRMAELFVEAGGEIRYGAEVTGLEEKANDVRISLANGTTLQSRHVIACAGLMADRLAQMCGVGQDFAIVPFKGEYYRLAPRHDAIVKHLIYPVPDPELPFLGIHLTRMIGGYVTVGPNAVLSLAREGYSKTSFNPRDVAAMASFPGFWRTLAQNLSSGLTEMANSVFRQRYLKACQRYCPSLDIDDLQPHPPGVRAQAVMRDGTLVHDFLILNTARTIHICNAPSPAATSAMPIAEHVRMLAAHTFKLRGSAKAPV
ncbi:L-2-hydroxyglutarate oxidase [Rhizobium rosettiformans]|uniref:L-2-hydroxyglutarate oxidase n=1 Tax=Rhizobium rosettiformans TaxID=1368430 RepID=UPI0028646B43|nr:L-2-hydroxyglutarate oxidase [Rhizobium rosettiformans]MDR7030953.1 L-2-hydroxyglutarate oxidase [Rhizobium rosettiformans]MDR7066828.1 L-2-hydroxyglutarate oxidase [Rhizobium rosettiformans]